MFGTEIVAEGYSPDTFGEVGRAVPRRYQIAYDRFERAGTSIGAHQQDLGARPIQDAHPDRMPLRGVAVEQALGSIASDRGSELPPEVQRVAEPEVQALSA